MMAEGEARYHLLGCRRGEVLVTSCRLGEAPGAWRLARQDAACRLLVKLGAGGGLQWR